MGAWHLCLSSINDLAMTNDFGILKDSPRVAPSWVSPQIHPSHSIFVQPGGRLDTSWAFFSCWNAAKKTLITSDIHVLTLTLAGCKSGILFPKSADLLWWYIVQLSCLITGGFYDVDQSQTPKPPPLLILPVLLGTITVAIPPDHQRLSITTSPGPKHQVESSPPASKFSCKTRNQLIQLWSLPTKKNRPASHPMKKSKLPNFPSLTNLHHESCSKEKTHHENQGLLAYFG